MAQQYNINAALHGVNGFGRQFPKVVFNATLAITTDTSFTVPLSSTIGLPLSQAQSSGTYLLIFGYTPSATGNVLVALNGAAAAPAGASFAAATSIVNPTAIVVKGGDVVHFFATAANISVSVEVWPWQE